jgi:hypothetical protein
MSIDILKRLFEQHFHAQLGGSGRIHPQSGGELDKVRMFGGEEDTDLLRCSVQARIYAVRLRSQADCSLDSNTVVIGRLSGAGKGLTPNSGSKGRKIENTVPVAGEMALLFTLIFPLCF